MKKSKKFQKLLVLISLLPIIPTIILAKQESVVDINAVSNNLVIITLIVLTIFYLASIGYKYIYFSKESKKIIAPLAFIFVSNLIHHFAFFVGSISLYVILTNQVTSTIALNLVLASIVLLIQTLNFEKHSENSPSSTPLIEILQSAQNSTFIPEIFISFTPVVILGMTGLLNLNIIKDFGLFGLIVLWDILFTQIVRPQLFTFLENE